MSAPTPPEFRARPGWIVLALVAAGGFALRLAAARGDLWLDEILSVELARMAASPATLVSGPDALTDNNHLLNTLWLSATAAASEPVVQRLHSILAGTASIGLAWLFARRWSRPAAVVAAVLVAGSFVLIHYGSEARGYALLVAFTLLALVALDRWHVAPRHGWLSTFWGASILATLAHITFIQALVAALVWSAVTLVRRAGATAAAGRLAAAYWVPAGFVTLFYAGFFQHVRILGADQAPLADVVRDTAAYVVGWPRGGVAAGLALVLLGGVVIAAARALRRRKDDAWVLLAMLTLGSPILMMLAVPPAFMTPRYFMLPIVGVLLALAVTLGRLFETGRSGRVASVAALAALLGGNAVDTSRLLAWGRGQYSAALIDMAAATPGPRLRIGGDHPLRQPFVIRYHQRSLPQGTTAQYITDDQLPRVAPDWVVLHSFDPVRNPPRAEIQDPVGRGYRLFRVYPSAPLSGWYWYLYRAQP